MFAGRLVAIGVAALTSLGVGSAGAAPLPLPPSTPGEIKLTSAFAAPIAASEPVCTPEPGGQFIYGTQVPFDPALPESDSAGHGRGYPAAVNSGIYNHPASVAPSAYRPANKRSRDTLVKKLDAGANNDLCFGFTLTPNMEQQFQSTEDPSLEQSKNRLQADPMLPDVQETHVADGEDHDDLKNAVIDMPAGFAGTLDGVPTCDDNAPSGQPSFNLGNYNVSSCPANTQVGTLFVRVSARPSTGISQHLVYGGVANPTGDPNTDPGALVNLKPGPNDVARFGAYVYAITGVAPVKFTVRLVLTSDGRIRAITENAPRNLYLEDDLQTAPGPDQWQLKPGAVPGVVYLETIGIRVWGAAGAGNHPSLTKSFAEWGTNCTEPISAKVSVETYAGTKSSIESDPIKLAGCEALPFLPSIKVEDVDRRAGVPTGAKITVGLGQTSSGPKTALLKDAAVTLPPGLEIGAQVASGASGLPLCSAAQFDKGSTAANSCPAGSKVGDVNIVSPLIDRQLAGSVYLGAQAAVGELPNLYIEAAPTGSSGPDAPRIKLVGEAKVDENGRLTTTFKDAPQLRFSELRLTFPSGPNALFSTPRTCGDVKATGSFTSWASPTPVNVESPAISIDQGCDPAAFAPSFSMVPANASVGASSPTKISIERPDRSAWLKDVKVSLPAGFLADLKSASECSKADAAAAACPDSSRIATVTTTAGVGENPLTLKGAMYLVERDEGAVAGAAIVVNAKIGELDLGNVVVPGRIELRPLDAGLVLTTSAPLRFRGLALNLRSIVVDLDRDNFPLNPTACGPLRATAELTGDGGQTAAPTSDVSYTGCGNLPFQPAFSAKLSGDTKPKGHPQVDVTMVPRAGDANLKSVKVQLPSGISTDLANLKVICPRADFEAGNCADGTKVGTVKATVSITNDEITGTVNLVRVEGTALPGLGLIFSGRYAVRLLSVVKLDASRRLATEFASIPDLPLRRMELTIAGGPKSPIQLPSTACTADSSWDAVLTGQGGQSQTVKQVEKCNTPAVPTTSLSWKAKTGLKFTLKAPAGKTLKSGKLTLPKGFKVVTKKSVQKKYLKVKLSGGKGKVKVTKTSISVTGTGAGPRTVSITVRPKGYTLPKSYKKKLKKGKKLKLKTRTVTNEGVVTAKTLTVKTK